MLCLIRITRNHVLRREFLTRTMHEEIETHPKQLFRNSMATKLSKYTNFCWNKSYLITSVSHANLDFSTTKHNDCLMKVINRRNMTMLDRTIAGKS